VQRGVGKAKKCNMKGCEWGENPHCDGKSRAAREGRDAARRFEGFYLRVYIYKSYEPGFLAILSYPMMSSPCGLPHLGAFFHESFCIALTMTVVTFLYHEIIFQKCISQEIFNIHDFPCIFETAIPWKIEPQPLHLNIYYHSTFHPLGLVDHPQTHTILTSKHFSMHDIRVYGFSLDLKTHAAGTPLPNECCGIAETTPTVKWHGMAFCDGRADGGVRPKV